MGRDESGGLRGGLGGWIFEGDGLGVVKRETCHCEGRVAPHTRGSLLGTQVTTDGVRKISP